MFFFFRRSLIDLKLRRGSVLTGKLSLIKTNKIERADFMKMKRSEGKTSEKKVFKKLGIKRLQLQ